MKFISVYTLSIVHIVFLFSSFAYAMQENIVQSKQTIMVLETFAEKEEKEIYEKILKKHHKAYEKWFEKNNKIANQKFNPFKSFEYILKSTLQDLADRENEFKPLLSTECVLNDKEIKKYERPCPLLNLQMNLKRTVLDDIIISALWLDLIAQKNDHTGPIFFLGRSPGHIKTAYEELLAHRTQNKASFDHLFEIPFSGTPGITKPLRKAYDLQDKVYEKEKNCLTQDRLQFYFDYLKSLGISDIQETIYLVDIIGIGGSLNSFIQILTLLFAQEQKPVPNIVFIGLSLPRKLISPEKTGKVIFAYDHDNKKISYKENKEFNIAGMELKAYALQMSFVTIDLCLDHPFFQTVSNKAVYFPAGLWHKNSQQRLHDGDKYYQKEFKELVRNLIQKRLPALLSHFTKNKFHKEHEELYCIN